MITCVAAGPSIDKTFEVERIALGEIHRPLAFTQVAGGKAINAARAAARLGADVEVVVVAGGHTGRWLVEQIEAEGIPALVIHGTAETRSSLSVHDRTADNLTEFYEAGAGITGAEWGELESLAVRRTRAGGWLAISGSLPAGAPADGYARLLAAARAAGSGTALDATGEALRLGLNAVPDLVKVNAGEASQHIGRELRSAADVLAAARELTEARGVVAITRGEAGAVLCAPGEGCWDGAPPTRGAFPVGSGDSFLAGLLAARQRGQGWEAALALGLGASAASAEVPAPGGFERERAEDLASRAEIRALGA